MAVTITRRLFDEILEKAVPSSYWSHIYPGHDDWKRAVAGSDVRLQWDPDHHPYGAKVERRAIQLGLRGGMLRRYADTEVVEIEDISEYVGQQRRHIEARDLEKLLVPNERVYMPSSVKAITSIGLKS